MSKRIKIGLIGCGMISGSHVNGYLAHPQHAEIVAVCDTVDANAQRRAAEVLSGAESRANAATADAEKADTVEARDRLKENAACWAEYKDNGVKIFSDFNEIGPITVHVIHRFLLRYLLNYELLQWGRYLRRVTCF